MADEPVWEGADALRGSLRAIDGLEAFPSNPRRSNTEAVAGSLDRFGQLKPVVVDGNRIVAGHHVTEAAAMLGWTHVAVVDHQFAGEDEQRAFLIADNRVTDAGLGAGYDDQLLAEQLLALAEVDGLTGTGYNADDLDSLLASLKDLDVPPAPVIDADRGKREHRDPSIKELVLLYDQAQFEQVDVWLGIVERETGSEGTSASVFQALKLAAQQLNG